MAKLAHNSVFYGVFPETFHFTVFLSSVGNLQSESAPELAIDQIESLLSMAFRPGEARRMMTKAEEAKAKAKLLLPPWMRSSSDHVKSAMRKRTESMSASTESREAIIARCLAMLTSIFPSWEEDSLRTILEAHEYVIDDTITTVLRMEEEEEEASKRLSFYEPPKHLRYTPKHPIPDDFLRVPGYLEPEGDGDTDADDAGRESIDDFDMASSRTLLPLTSTIAEDDGTIYGKEFAGATSADDEAKLPPPTDAPEARVAFVDPNANPEVLQQKKTRPKSRTDTLFSQLTVIKRSKLDIVGAEDRIRTREPHRVLDCLSKASVLYRNGLISSIELETLRSLILRKMQPTKMLMDTSVNMNAETITDHEWNGLVLKAKGLRQALSIRIIKTFLVGQHTEYEIRTNDLETGVVVVTRKRFRELHKLHRKLSPLSARVSAFPFPTRHTVSKKEDWRLASQRQPLLEAYLRLVASLVTPSPLTSDRATALQMLQSFLNLPSPSTLSSKTTLPWTRVLRVYAFHVLNDGTTPEGKVLKKMTIQSLDDLGDCLDNVQAYMLEHRFQDMKALLPLPPDDDDVLHEWISDAIRHEVEEMVCIPVLPSLLSRLQASVADRERVVLGHMSALRAKPQSFFGIPLHRISVSSWVRPIETLRDVDAMTLPLDKHRRLVEAAMLVHIVYQEEHDGADVLSGDDFLPVFIYVIVQSRLGTPVALLQALNVLCDPEKRIGQNGYYLASYEAALEHLASPNCLTSLACADEAGDGQ
ncbi:hypothetical protein SPRG_07260 [Saprolegnia parasitica CBS 223.65]|uniref:VPS9 domain-containing protein n=1 Tax=Saprolegnia parasitica (strain CBS 223.65) TaxID=695850 RepID=A0A067CBU6_SAPPC|nr:hypothetical protein SPRG_07260 [Saprolegnia parasitica CBS 223.65]KDO27983.1 hypothetical protein SPRG_07260 [Saprolegnia parasitica CBS 223.65]|eukprot:XP_012201432.1 hypothetical protein SPRG_07260 [Saprolegnia parasitica CBS 223.65]